MTKSMHLRYLRTGITLFIIVYFLIGLVAWKIGRQRGSTEVFPVFSWSLFSSIPQPIHRRFDVIIYEHNGRKVIPPATFNKTSNSIVSGKNINAVIVIQKLGKAYIRKDNIDFSRFKNLFEKNHLNGKVKYELVSETYNPIDKYRSGKSQIRHLGYFMSDLQK